MQRLAPLVVALAGCHLLVGHGPGSGAGHDDGVGGPERGILDGLRRERLASDGAPWSDGARADRGCVEPLPPTVPGFITPCPASLTSCQKENADCDGMLNAVDPYAGCNELLFEEGFSHDVIADGSWSAVPSGSWSWSCGALSQTSTANTYATAFRKTAPALPAGFLVEARVVLGKQGGGSHWRVGVIGRVGTPLAFIGCSIWEDPNAGAGNPVPDPDVVITLKNDKTGTFGIDAWPYPHQKVPALAATEGTAYTLQLWYTPDISKLWAVTPTCGTAPSCPAVICRVCTESSCIQRGFYALYMDLAHLQYLPAGPGSVGLRTFNRAASFDRIRVYELKNP